MADLEDFAIQFLNANGYAPPGYEYLEKNNICDRDSQNNQKK